MPATEFQASQTSWMSRNKLAVMPWAFLIPALIFFAIYVVIPIFQSITLSFYEWNGLYDGDGNSTAIWVGFENYKRLWSDPKFWVSLKNNVLW
ncbi:MAG: sugar ABC transporter permease, partial [Amylibacter sp.]|nr:sugar ABC transporter permease [Amylibacter sp.]